jgi:hypothetical protein
MIESCQTKLKEMEGKNDNNLKQIVQKNGEIDKLEVLKFKNNPSIFPDLE